MTTEKKRSADISRRSFLEGATSLALSTPLAAHGVSAAVPLHAPAVLSELRYSQVELTDGPLRQQFQSTQQVLLGLSNDRLMKVFRQRAGLPAPGEEMGGWYDNEGFRLPSNPDGTPNFAQADFHGYVPGHTFGQHISALARGYAVTGNPAMKQKIDALIEEYARTLDAKATFFVDYRLPAYTYDKLAIGLLDAFRYAHNTQALTLHNRLTHAVLAYLPPKALNREEMRAKPHPDESWTWDESYTLPENLYLAYTITGDSFYRSLAARYLEDDTWFTPLSQNQNVLAGKHAYSHVNSLSSAMQAYFVDRSDLHYRAARNFYSMLEEQTFSTGGWGPSESLLEPGKGKLGESLKTSAAGFETPCGAYGQFKLTRYLMRATGDSRFGDNMERVLYNTVLGSKPLQPDGRAFYYSDYQPNAQKAYFSLAWPCCAGTLPQIAADYHISIYLQRHDGLAVNLFVPSRVQWTHKGASCKLEQITEYPLAERILMRYSASSQVRQTIAVRIPAWAGHGSKLLINGQPQPAEPLTPGTFVALSRLWKPGDQIELTLDFPTRLQAVDEQHPQLASLLWGPLVLFAISESSKPTPSLSFHRKDLLESHRVSPQEWATRSEDGSSVRLRPFFCIDEETYSTYLQLTS